MSEAHHALYIVHLNGTKMYRDVNGLYWWNNMKQDIARFVELCSTYQQVKAEHQRPARMLKPLLIPKWKWDETLFWGYPRHPSGKILYGWSSTIL
jgi:hypothetical protein